jgi:hypothetical protein
MSMIEIQEAYIARLIQADAKRGSRASGCMFARSATAARKEAAKALAKIGYPELQIDQIIRDARDMFELERLAEAA